MPLLLIASVQFASNNRMDSNTLTIQDKVTQITSNNNNNNNPKIATWEEKLGEVPFFGRRTINYIFKSNWKFIMKSKQRIIKSIWK